MKRLIFALLLTVFIGMPNFPLEAQLTKSKILGTIRDETGIERDPGRFRRDLKALSQSNDETAALILQILRENVSLPEGTPERVGERYLLGLIYAFSDFADDATLAAGLESMARIKDKVLRRKAFEVLSEHSGPAVDEALRKQIVRSLESLPKRVGQTNNDEINREEDSQAIVFFYCLKGLLHSQSDKSKNAGKEYWKKFVELYSDSDIGRRVIKEFRQELKKTGVILEEGETQ